MGDARGILVLGCPRSGTTAIGRYIGSAASVCDLGEFGGFHLALYHGPRELRRMPGRFKDEYLEALGIHTAAFARSAAHNDRCGWFIDHTPWNLLSVDKLSALLPDAVFVLCVRNYRGVIQSLQRSYSQGFEFAGRTATDSAKLWSRFYACSTNIPRDRLVTVSFDQLCLDPVVALEAMHRSLEVFGLRTTEMDLRVFARSHAVPVGEERPTIAVIHPATGTARLASRETYDQAAWTPRIEKDVWPIVAPVHDLLASTLAEAYMEI